MRGWCERRAARGIGGRNNSAVRGGGLAVGAAADCACELVADGLTCRQYGGGGGRLRGRLNAQHPHASLVDYPRNEAICQ